MKTVKQEDYALVLVCELAKNYKRKILPLSKISHDHGISLLYLKKIARLLRQARIIESHEGAGGGYTLLSDPTGVSVWDVVSAVTSEGGQKIPTSLREICPLYSECLPQHIKKTIVGRLQESFQTITLESLINPFDPSQG